jgi:hypothetical protein
MLSILGGTGVLGRIGVGGLLDRFFGAQVALVVNLIIAAGIFCSPGRLLSLLAALRLRLLAWGPFGEAPIIPYLLTR